MANSPANALHEKVMRKGIVATHVRKGERPIEACLVSNLCGVALYHVIDGKRIKPFHHCSSTRFENTFEKL